mgnify:CR=1 FL=1
MYRFSYKYLLLALCMLSTLSLMGQNPPIALPADGDWPTIVGDSIMLIGPNQESLTEEQPTLPAGLSGQGAPEERYDSSSAVRLRPYPAQSPHRRLLRIG